MRSHWTDLFVPGDGPEHLPVDPEADSLTCVECGALATTIFVAGDNASIFISGWTNVSWCDAHKPTATIERDHVTYRRRTGEDVVTVWDFGGIARVEDGRVTIWNEEGTMLGYDVLEGRPDDDDLLGAGDVY